MLKFIVSDINEAPENLRGHYKQEGDKWVLQVEGGVAREKLDEFRQNNVNYLKQIDELKKKYEGVDADEYRRLKGIEKDLEDKKLSGKDAEKILEQRTASMKAEHDKVLKEKDDALTKANSELARLKISEAAVTVALEKGLKASAKDDLVARANNVFRLKDGKPVAYNGDQEVYGTTGDLMTINEYVDGLVKSAPHLFEPSDGTGAGGGGAGGGNTHKGGNKLINPWKKETLNLTAQGKIVRENPQLATRMAAEAGVQLKLPAKAA